MALSPVYLNGMISATPDISTVRQTDDMKAALVQSTTETDVEEIEDEKAHSVYAKDNADGTTAGFDARNKGNNEYAGDGGANRPKKPKGDGRVIVKNKGGFDITI